MPPTGACASLPSMCHNCQFIVCSFSASCVFEKKSGKEKQDEDNPSQHVLTLYHRLKSDLHHKHLNCLSRKVCTLSRNNGTQHNEPFKIYDPAFHFSKLTSHIVCHNEFQEACRTSRLTLQDCVWWGAVVEPVGNYTSGDTSRLVVGWRRVWEATTTVFRGSTRGRKHIDSTSKAGTTGSVGIGHHQRFRGLFKIKGSCSPGKSNIMTLASVRWIF